ncbi:MAG: dihydropteroate synthase [Actinobacteria bacterium]|nr:dihydropteroate synthase [Actinomycetota bacterium]
MRLVHARGDLSLDVCRVMGIVNRTPDSFFDGGRMGLAASIDHAQRLVDEGADLLDIGAVKAGPGEPVTETEELERLMPALEAIAGRCDVPISIETSRPRVARDAIEAGAAIVNDVAGLVVTELASVCADTGAGLILMHNGGQIRGRPRHPRYDDVVAEVMRELEAMAAVAETAGVPREAIVLDAGLDFGKTTHHSLELVRRTEELVASGRPLLVAPSRKDVVGETLDLPPPGRLAGTLALVALSVEKGAHIVRVHDVAPAVEVVRMVEATVGRRDPENPVRGLWD